VFRCFYLTERNVEQEFVCHNFLLILVQPVILHYGINVASPSIIVFRASLDEPTLYSFIIT
jgi:hypothetical protein